MYKKMYLWLGIFAFYVVIYAVKLKQVKAAIKKELIAAQQARAAQARQVDQMLMILVSETEDEDEMLKVKELYI